MQKIIAPVKDFSGKVAGVQFVDGVGETDNENAVAYFRRHKYGVEEPQEAAEAAEAAAEEKAPEVPKRSDSKPTWIAFVTSEAAGDKRLDQADAEGKTRDQLAEHVLGPKEAQ